MDFHTVRSPSYYPFLTICPSYISLRLSNGLSVARWHCFYVPQTGRCKGFAFVEFQCDEVAKIAAQTMNNYLMFNKLLKCKFWA